MMIVLGITVAVIILLITTLAVLRRRKKCASCSLISESKVPEPVKEATDKPVVNTVNAAMTAAKVVAPKAKEATVVTTKNISALPQDSILRRHYFTHLCIMLEALVPPRPAESVLRRHYDMMIAVKIVQCLTDINAKEQLICDYEQINA
jgi:hypothetical protein